jgi:hypothetical protein
MRIHNLFEDAGGESHFRDVDRVEQTPSGKLSKRLPATGIVFGERDGEGLRSRSGIRSGFHGAALYFNKARDASGVRRQVASGNGRARRAFWRWRRQKIQNIAKIF